MLQLIESAEDLQWIVKEGNHAPYVAVISELNLTESVIRALQQATSRVTGLVVLHNISDSASGAVQSTSELSFDSKCPAARYSLYSNDSEWKDCKSGNWNPPGNSLLFEDMAFPIFLLTSNSEIDSLVSAYRQHNQPKQASDGSRTPPTWPLVSVELTSTMYAFQSSQTCLRRNNLGQRAVLSPQSFCERVAPRSSICTLKPLASANNETSVRANRSVILVATTVDAETPFYAALTGARQLVSLATLFAVADAIGRVKQQITDNNASLDVAFVTFYGEALDRGPSLRFAYDLSGGAGAQAVPSRTAAIRWQHVHSVIELGQLADAEKDGSDYVYYLHWDPLSSRSSQLNQSVNSLLSTLQRAAKLEASNSTFRVAGSDIPLPPSSGQSMLRIASPQPAVVLLSDHRKQFLNRFYQSTLDTLASLNYAPANGSQYSQLTERVASLATSVARTVMATALNCSVDDSRVKQTLATRVEADRLLSCLLVNASCELFRMALDSQIEVPSKPPVFLFSNAISFARAGQSVPTSLLGWYLGERLTNITKADQCTQLSTSRAPYSAVWSRSSYCVVSLAEAMDSMSPAFLIDGTCSFLLFCQLYAAHLQYY